MERKIIIGLAGTLLVLLGLVVFVFDDYQELLSRPAVSPNILFLTQPVTSLQGKIEKIDGDILTIGRNPDNPKPKEALYKVKVGPKATISRQVSPIPYLFKAITPSLPKRLSFEELKVGEIVSMPANADLRTLRGNEFVAYSLEVAPKAIAINGIITNRSGDILTVKGRPQVAPFPGRPDPSQLGEADYEVAVNQDTEISRTIVSNDMAKAPHPEKLAPSDLKKGIQVSVYTDVDVLATTKVRALRIEPLMPLAVTPSPTIPTSTPSATSSAGTSPLPSPQEP